MNPVDNDLFVVVPLLAGLCVGSFLNVVIWRVPQGMSVVRPPSHCPGCGTALAPWWNVPVLSWLALRGRARCCGAAISVRYPLVEAACAALFTLVWWRCPPAAVPAYAAAAAGLLALCAIDVEHQRLPDRVLLPTAIATAAGLAAAAAATGDTGALGRAAAGAVAGVLAIGLIHVVQPAGMGFGDVKLAGLCGLLLGWQGALYIPVGLFAAFVAGAVVGVVLLAGGAGRRTRLPFGPFLAAAALGVALFGAPLVGAVGRLA